jgi:flagellar hook assembly protein FlgD
MIRFELPQQEMVELSIYNLAGQEVTTLANGRREAGSYALRWDGRGEDGRELASGVYLCRLRAGEKVVTRKLLLIR